MDEQAWTLRPATGNDRKFLYELHRAALGPYVDATWGWDEDAQIAFFDARFDPARRQVVQVAGADVGVLEIDERPDEIYLAMIALLPAWQGRGIGSAVIRSLLERAASSRRAVTLRVLESNPRAIALYESLGFTRTGQTETHVYMRAVPSDDEASPPSE